VANDAQLLDFDLRRPTLEFCVPPADCPFCGLRAAC
jgi:hypothetical protein